MTRTVLTEEVVRRWGALGIIAVLIVITVEYACEICAFRVFCMQFEYFVTAPRTSYTSWSKLQKSETLLLRGLLSLLKYQPFLKNQFSSVFKQSVTKFTQSSRVIGKIVSKLHYYDLLFQQFIPPNYCIIVKNDLFVYIWNYGWTTAAGSGLQFIAKGEAIMASGLIIY